MAHRTLVYSIFALYRVCTTNAHVILSQPTPYFATQLAGNKGPLPDGASYPCMWPTWSQESGLGSQSERTTLQVGAQNTVKFDGTAVHNGGGCQLSITTDTTPQRNSTFKVFLSIEGGCPGMGSTAAEFPYTLPASIPSGDAIFAWTWFPVSSGGKEMYMNCAPVTVTGGADDDAEFRKLPDLFVANLANDDEFTCQTQDNRVVEFPDPGELFLNQAKLKIGNVLGALAAPTDKNTGGRCEKAGAMTLASQGKATGAAIAAAPASTVDGSSSDGFNGTCSSGELICNGISQFGTCNWGKIVWQDVVAGTICENGAIKTLKKARAAAEVRGRLSHFHPHRLRPFRG
ncbi:hypothetical protein B0J12DRAFT_586289 [Macrophomina phaseolina]|uniref:Lytic polysaccharide monooxygenase n=1 Tax=Macrophomina phaseolina TaxID=35725 RepID=A0ABQ8FRG0_9PEZI|nr:hypothetical protein B0J12DRAFT_586289 [Macrophomina phaseolina]